MQYIFANWKNALSVDESVALARAARDIMAPAGVQLALFPNAGAFAAVREAAGDSIVLGMQDVADPCDASGTYALVGHSDRRATADTDAIVARKLQAAADAGVIPVLCVGETKAEREAGKRDERIRVQTTSALTGARVQKVFIAYEPVWAIGSGDADKPEDTADAIRVIKETLAAVAPGIEASFLYGGSVNPQNVASYMKLPDIAGVLVGKASITASSIAALVAAL